MPLDAMTGELYKTLNPVAAKQLWLTIQQLSC